VRVIVCGSRDWNYRQVISDRLALLPGDDDTVVVHGAAKGADRMAEQEAQKLGLLVEAHPPDYEKFSAKRAPLFRNEKMASLGADLCIAFWDGRSTGTKHMMECAERRGIPVEVVPKPSPA
jgi:hypothetical protein